MCSFLLVSLSIDEILQESTIYRRREKLRCIKDGLGLGDAYVATIERIKAQDGDKPRLGMAALMWIIHAEKPFEADEFCHALSVELGSGVTEINACNVPSMSTLMSCCQGLITVDKKTSTVRLIHSTLKNYFSDRPNSFSRPHATMAEVCLTYLNYKQVRALSAHSQPHTLDVPFLEYCSLYWGVHAKTDLSDDARSLVLELFRDYDGHISTKRLLENSGYLLESCRMSSTFSGLHCASFFGIFELVDALIEMGCYDINAGDCRGYTPLAWAAHNGHLAVVEMLVGKEVINPDRPDIYGRTPLWHATDRGHESVVVVLLGQEMVIPDKPDKGGQTPLARAAWNGHEGVVNIMIQRGVANPDKPDKSGRTPLWHAASAGHDGMVQILLECENVNPNKRDKNGRTPLTCAARNGHEGVARLLLERVEVYPDLPENYGRTPLSYAAKNGHEGVVKMLLGREGVNPNQPDIRGQTPFMKATRWGHQKVAALLEAHKAVPTVPFELEDTAS